MWCDDGSLLHLRLGEVCDRLAGFDLSEPGLRILADAGVEDLHRLDLLERYEVERAWNDLTFEPEIVIAGELLEHLDRAGVVLENCRRCMAAQSRMVITVPNAFSLRGFLHLLRGYEKVANDHVGYYSFSNIRELAERNGFSLREVRWYRYSSTRKPLDQALEVLIRPATWIWPQLSEGLIADCGLASEYQPVHS
jgi:hypothetical protein